MERIVERTAEEIGEIERHKYFLSEKRGFDVGWAFAERDWEEQFAAEFRRNRSQSAELSSPQEPAPSSTASAAPSRVSEKIPSRGGIRMLFLRMFHSCRTKGS